METMYMQNFGGKTKSITVFLKVAYPNLKCETIHKIFAGPMGIIPFVRNTIIFIFVIVFLTLGIIPIGPANIL